MNAITTMVRFLSAIPGLLAGGDTGQAGSIADLRLVGGGQFISTLARTRTVASECLDASS